MRRALVWMCAAAALLVLGTGSASAQGAFHGIAFTKGCDSPTKVGDPYNCSYQILNVADTAQDTLTFNGISDQVHAFTGDVNSGNLLGALELVFSSPTVSCVGGSGAGTAAIPYIGATMCTLPFGTSITSNSHSFYTVQASDFQLPAATLTDTASLAWNDLCDKGAPPPAGNCTTGNQTASAGSSSAVLQLPSSTATQIHNAAHAVVTTVDSGTTVHDFVSVTGQPGSPVPTGNVHVDWFLNGTCTGNPVATSGSVGPLDASGNFDATAFAFTVNGAGPRAFRATYEGDATYAASTGACEPLQVVDANIQITPPTAANQVGTNHTLTGHVNVDDGSGPANAPDGTVITFSIQNGPGGFVGPNSCTTAGGTGSCTVQITSTVTGQTVVRASTTVSVAGVSVTRSTGDGLPGDSPDAQKTWAEARISITPSATNPIGASHTFTVTLEKDLGDGAGFVPAAGEHVDVTLTDSFGAAHTAPTGTCTNAGANTDAAGQCTITFTSPTPGKVTGTASSSLSVAGVPITVTTTGVAPNSSPAVKTFVDAGISIIPQVATNPVGTDHLLAGQVLVNAGDGTGYVPAPDGTVINFSLTNANGASATFVGPSSCTTIAGTGRCAVAISSPTAGTTAIHATTTVTVGGVSLTRATGDGFPTDSPDAQKTWVSARISIAPSATNAVGAPHTFTVTLEKDAGDGAGFVPAAGEHVDVTLTDSNGAVHTAPTGTCTNAGGNTDAAGQCAITFTSNSAGKVTGHATATLGINGVGINVATDGSNGNSGDAVKTFVDANIQVTPQTATNPVGTNHTLTAHVNVDDGSGGGFVNAPDGTVVNFSLTNASGATAVFVGPSSCTTAAGTGSCTVVINSPTGGTTTVHATTTVSVAGVSLTRATGDGLAGDSPDAVKNWAGARISIAPSATNEVGASHTFTVTLEKDTGGGFAPAAGEHVDVTLTDSNGAAHTAPSGTCTNAGANTDAAGQCTIVFTSPTAGKVTGHASATLTINGATITVQTDGTGGNSPDAVKTFVDANIHIIPPTATNEVGTNHTLRGDVSVNDGSGGFVNAPDGTVITFTVANSNGATAAFVGPSSCTTIAGTGACTVLISSPTPGTTSIKASTTVTVGGVSLTRATGDGLSGDGPDAAKSWVDANIQITPQTATNTIGTNHTLTGHVSVNPGTGFVNAPDGTVINFSLSNAGGATAAFVGPSSCTTIGGTGACTVVISSPTAGTTTINASTNVIVNGVSLTRTTNGVGANSGPATKIWIAPSANIQISPLTASNEIGTNHTLTGHVNVSMDGVTFTNAPAGTVINFSLANANGATAAFVGPSSCSTVGNTGSCTVVISSPTPGTTTIHAASDPVVSGVTVHVETNGQGANSGDAAKNWVDANIQITPPTATNVIGTNHTLTGHVNVNPGTGFANAPDGTVISFTLSNAGGATAAFVGPASCTTAGGTGSCTVVISSPTTGTTTIHASSTVSVGGVSLTRATNGVGANSADAQKIWFTPDANIQISPPTATNAVGTNHTLTGHVNVSLTGAGFTNAPDGTVITFTKVSGPGSFVGPSTCTTAGGTGSCTVVITSATAGTTVVHAATDVTVSGVSLHRETNGVGANSGDAQKAWVDANIQITPATADNPVATNHTLTITVNAVGGTLAAGTATATIVSGPGSFVGPATCNYPGGGASGSCTVVITSNVTGTTVVSATSDISVNGISITRTTGTAANTAAGGSGNASKNWTSLASGRVTGGGSIFATVNGVPNVRVTHGFELRCDPKDKRQSLEINWDGGNNFHLSKIINSVICFDDPLSQPPPPPGTVIDTYAGDTLFNGQTGYHGYGYAVGTGTCNKLPATIYFILVDNGEPGDTDIAEYHITGGCTLDAGPAFITKGNHQFHKN